MVGHYHPGVQAIAFLVEVQERPFDYLRETRIREWFPPQALRHLERDELRYLPAIEVGQVPPVMPPSRFLLQNPTTTRRTGIPTGP